MAVAAAGTRVLIIDDDEAYRVLVTALLERCGYAVTAACDGEAALDLLGRSLSPAVIVTDMTMPRVDGLELCRRLRQSSDHRAVPVVVLTGNIHDPRVTELGTLTGIVVQDKADAWRMLGALLDRLVPRSQSSSVAL
jgi:CheY-like chemotaxis protein